MKKISEKIISLLLAFALFLPTLSFIDLSGIEVKAGSSAYLSGQPDVERIEKGTPGVEVYYNRHYGEGWDFDNGFTEYSVSATLRGNDFLIDYDYATDVNKGDSLKNYFFKFVQKNSKNGFACLETSSVAANTGKTYVEFDIKASVGANINCVMSILTQGSPYLEFNAVDLVNGDLIIFGKNFGSLGEEWCHVIIEMDLEYGPSIGDSSAIKYTAIVGDANASVSIVKYLDKASADVTSFRGLRQLRIGKASGLKAGSVDDWFGLDNFSVYSSPKGPAVLASSNYGSLVKRDKVKDFPIDKDIPDDIPAQVIIESSVIMKVNSANALIYGESLPLLTGADGSAFGAPYCDENGNVMVPIVPILDYADPIYRFNSTGYVCEVFSGGVYHSLAVERGYYESNGELITLSAPPAMRSENGDQVFYIALDDVETIFDGIYVTYDESGMIFISRVDDFLDRSNDADEQLIKDVAKRFIYSEMDFRKIVNSSGQKLVADYRGNPIKDKESFIDSFASLEEFDTLYGMFSEGTNNFSHPYIKTDQSRFDELHYTYLSTQTNEYSSYYDEELKWYIDTQITYADKYLKKYVDFKPDGSYGGLKLGHWYYDSEGKANPGSGWNTEVVEGVTNHSVAIMPYQGPEYNYNPATQRGYGQGYDPAGGRLNVLSDGEDCLAGALEPAALAYQITKDEKYLAFAYDWMLALCSWEHWGPGHYLNCANTASPIATAYDWLYNDFVRVYGREAVDHLADRIYENAVYEATVTLTGNNDEHGRRGDSSRYWAHVGNWNSCGALGMLIASLAVMDRAEYKDDCLFVIAASLGHYMERGLTYITLDGGYRESAGYWGAVRFMHMINKILIDTAGTDFGLADYPGLDSADYFGCMLESSNYKRWNYHDDWEGTQPSYWYYLSAELYDNPEYAAIRYEQIHSGNSSKAPHRYDVLYYNRKTVENIGDVNLPLDYSMTTIDATIVRDSWEKNSLFAGFMGGYNNVAHGQYDSGNWIYENKGIRWFVDLGADNYNLYGGGLAKGYYKYSAEGNNTLAIASLPHGQLMDPVMNQDTKGGQLISFLNNEFGSATVVDQKSVYGDVVEYAYRGMFVTNSRNTFVIQDEVKTSSPQTLLWFAHYNDNLISQVEISRDGRTAYMGALDPSGEFRKLRVSIISENFDLKFEIMDTYTYLLSGTPSIDYSPTNKPGIKENARDQFRKLVIKAENVTELKLAVVIEVVDPNEQTELGYKLGWNGQWDALRPMSTWVPEAETRFDEGEDDGGADAPGNVEKPKPSLYEIVSAANILKDLMKSDPLGKDRDAFFAVLSRVEYCLVVHGREFEEKLLVEALITYEEARRLYDAYFESLDNTATKVNEIAGALIGIR